MHNGSQAYRSILIDPFKERIRVNTPVKNIKIIDSKVLLTTTNNETAIFDKVIFACHADQALQLLDAPTDLQQKLLSTFKYQVNTATVHTDTNIMPANKKVWSSWNYRIEEHNGKQVPSTIYWMNRLQDVSKIKDYFVSINAVPGSISKDKIIREIKYEHPLFDVAAVQAQKELPLLNETGPLYFCGSYFKYGFHEDAYASAVALCKNFIHE